MSTEELPAGAASRRLRADSDAYVLKCMGDVDLALVEGQGVRVRDADGREYIDAISAEWVLNLGFRHPEVRQAILEQLDTIDYVSPVFESEARTALAKRLAELAPGRLQKVLYALSGGAAVEGAMHLAMRATGGSDFVCLDAAFHGRTFATIGLTYVHPGMVEGANQGLDRYLPRQMRVPTYNCYRCPLGLQRESCDLACADLVDFALGRGHLNGPAGFIVEPLQANGSMVPAPEGYLKRAHEICRSHDVPLIVDEVQGALCRCGPMYASERHGVEPEMIILGKALGGGLPLSATIAVPEYSELLPWEYGFTQAGNPVACAAALAMLEVMVRDDLPANSERMGALLMSRLEEIAEGSRLIGDVRGEGLMIGVELVRDRTTKEEAWTETDQVMAACLDLGLMVGKSGPVWGSNGNVIKFKPAVNVTADEIDEMATIFGRALARVEAAA
ncbi:MAG: aspartate aminotransferase family protein [Solirubrobacteraceae bacterium]|nr:aspartate aminotransferase family protein [Solirubrobacteraceae bacterium]